MSFILSHYRWTESLISPRMEVQKYDKYGSNLWARLIRCQMDATAFWATTAGSSHTNGNNFGNLFVLVNCYPRDSKTKAARVKMFNFLSFNIGANFSQLKATPAEIALQSSTHKEQRLQLSSALGILSGLCML